MYVQVEVDGSPVVADDLETVRVPLNEDGDLDNGEGEDDCPACGGEGSDTGDGGQFNCDTCKGSKRVRVPLAWANSAGIRLNEEDDSITVSISVGDPRGAFAFTVRRRPDTGELLLHTPYPGEPQPHMTLTQLHPGTYKVGD